MTDKRLGNITQKMVRPSEDKSNILYRRQKLNKDIKKEGESKQVPKSMKNGGIVKMQGGGAATRGMNFNRGY